MSGIVGDNVARASGVVASAGGGGKVLQIAQNYWTGTSSQTTGGYATYTDMSNTVSTITPTAAGSSILIFSNIAFCSTHNGGIRLMADIAGAGYNAIFQGVAAGSRNTNTYGNPSAVNSANQYIQSGQFLWTPTYTLTDVLSVKMMGSMEPSTPICINRGDSDTNANNRQRCVSTITLWEVAA